MKAKSVLFAALTAGLVVAVSGCGSSSSNEAGPTTSAGSSPSGTVRPTKGTSTPQNGQTVQPPAGDSDPPEADPDNTETVAPQEPTVAPGEPTVVPVTSSPAPNGGGHGLCFDLNSGLANSAINSLAAPSVGAWTNPFASNDPISAGCDGLLSWMTVESGNIHPYTHVLFFTNGTYLGTASANPYGYTEVIGKTRNTVSVQYRWPKPEDALCCPSGGPNVVTFTLSGGKVQANGQFPPDN